MIATAAALVAADDVCSWCEAGDLACVSTFADFTEDLFLTSVSQAASGHAMPYWRPSGLHLICISEKCSNPRHAFYKTKI